MATEVPFTADAVRSIELIPCAHAPTKPPAHVYDKIITVAVGPDNAKKKFKIYRGLLCHFSSYFDRMLNGSFREGGSTYLRLKDTDADTFDVFFYWLNSGVVGLADSGGLLDWGKVMKAYVFSDFHQAPIFKNAVLESLYTQTQTTFTPCENFINNIYTSFKESNSNTITMSHPLAWCAHPWTAPTITNKHDTVTIKVGAGSNIQQYDLHVEALRARSRHFHEALSDSSNEERTAIHLACSTPMRFDVFANWLYNGSLDSSNDSSSRYLFLCELHVSADTFDIPLLRNKIVDVFFNKLLRDAQPLPYNIMKYIEEHLRDSALRTMMQDIMLNCGETEDMAEWKVNLAKGFRMEGGRNKNVAETIVRNSDVREYLVALRGKVCEKYHEHVERDEMVVEREEMWFFDPPLK
ncbi:uncharacterized protein J4E84_006052 [Alternaria hordeiaustralica]|uniref:uncharacterized protein n=1 Tax=Alternaria hordeiaustralica TaxID=1187925 RepID=UPI0020C5768C|nr:uncharacterized protein J4E84_006052 [Alternaria hordeiaustralica]KAI4685325.1 hypothetical protein J4E84_006052 [Alternaria hordeiaustralica]